MPSGEEMKSSGDALGEAMKAIGTALERFVPGLVFSQIVNGNIDRAEKSYKGMTDKQKRIFADSLMEAMTFIEDIAGEVARVVNNAPDSHGKPKAAPGYEACVRCGSADNVACVKLDDDMDLVEWDQLTEVHVGRYYNTNLFSRYLTELDKQEEGKTS
jgi:hypothetical protein